MPEIVTSADVKHDVDQIDVFFGELSDTIAKIYVRAGEDQFVGGEIQGTVRGPECEFSQTLMCDAPLRSLGDGDSLLAAATLPDPCPWTPELPMLYEVSVQVVDEQGNLLVEGRRSLGLRPLGARGADLFMSGRRWVIRGVGATSLAEARLADVESIDHWRDAQAAMFVHDPSDGLCAAASRRGVLLIAAIEAGASGAGLETRLRRLARWPAVAIVALTGDADVNKSVRQAVPNLLFAERRKAGQAADGGEHCVAPWADLVLYEGGAAEDEATENVAKAIGAAMPDRQMPVLAVRAAANRFASVAEARAACDALQRDLAPYGDFAGYIV